MQITTTSNKYIIIHHQIILSQIMLNIYRNNSHWV